MNNEILIWKWKNLHWSSVAQRIRIVKELRYEALLLNYTPIAIYNFLLVMFRYSINGQTVALLVDYNQIQLYDLNR